MVYLVKLASPNTPLPPGCIIEVEDELTVMQLKMRICQTLQRDLSVEHQKLIYRGKILQDAQQMKDFIDSADCATGTVTFHLVSKQTSSSMNGQASSSPADASFSDIATTDSERASGQQPTVPPAYSNLHDGQLPELQTRSIAPTEVTHVPLNIFYQAILIDGVPHLCIRPPMPPNPSMPSVLQRQITMPPNSTIPIRSEEGGAAVLVSPEGVQALAASGVQLANAAGQTLHSGTQQPAIQSLGALRAAEIAAQVRARANHLWLFLRLAFLVSIFSANATWYRFIILNAVATLVFFWETGQLRPVHAFLQQMYQPHRQATTPNSNSVARPDAQAPNTQDEQRSRFREVLRHAERVCMLFVASIVPSLHDHEAMQAAALAEDPQPVDR